MTSVSLDSSIAFFAFGVSIRPDYGIGNLYKQRLQI